MLTLIEPCKTQIILSADTFKVLTLLAITPCHVKYNNSFLRGIFARST